MAEITVNSQKPYKVVIGSGILSSLGSSLGSIGSYRKAAVITDATVASLYLNGVLDSLDSTGIQALPIIIGGGEQNKNLECYKSILETLANAQINSSDLIISLGGGVVSDISGFVAATYMRGVDCLHLPTTLLAVIDASVGGKAGVDLDAGKNLVGAFHNPRLVLADIGSFETLPQEEYLNGVCEGIKYAVLAGGKLAELIEQGLDRTNLEEFCGLCVSYKRDIVESDEHDVGRRRLLNLGHTFGHAIECLSSYSIPHGLCVAKGLNIIAKAASRSGKMTQSDLARLQGMLSRYGINTHCPFTKEELLIKMRNDKKAEGEDAINIVDINGFANCIVRKTTWKELSDYVDDCID